MGINQRQLQREAIEEMAEEDTTDLGTVGSLADMLSQQKQRLLPPQPAKKTVSY